MGFAGSAWVEKDKEERSGFISGGEIRAIAHYSFYGSELNLSGICPTIRSAIGIVTAGIDADPPRVFSDSAIDIPTIAV